MKAIILNSGTGSRMGDLTSDKPKCLVSLGDRTILGLQLSFLAENGINEVIITTGPFENSIKEFVNANFSKMNIKFVKNSKYKFTNYIYSMWLAKDFIDDDIILMHGDMVFERAAFEMIMRKKEGNHVLINKDVPPPEKDFKGHVEDGIIKKIGVDVFGEGCFFLAPVYRFTKKSFNIWMKEIGKFVKQDNVSVYAENALNNLLHEEILLNPIYFSNEFCMEIDTKEDLEYAKKNIR